MAPGPVRTGNERTFAIISLVLGILNLCAWLLPICGFPLAIAGVVFARQIQQMMDEILRGF